MKENEGFTLIELVIVISILGMIALMASTLLAEAIRLNRKAQEEVMLSSEMQFALRRMVDEVRDARSITKATCLSSSHSLIFTSLKGKKIQYEKEGEELKRQENNNAKRTVVSGLKTVTFTCLDAEYKPTTDHTQVRCLAIRGASERYSITIPFSTIVCLRNIV